jgi:lipoprotein-anchoring transpeptidase ErfK/SrfK
MRRQIWIQTARDKGNGNGAKLAIAIAALLVAATHAAASGHSAALERRSVAEDAAPKRTLVISVPDRKLALLEDGRVIKIYPVAVGAPHTPTPRGEFTIINRIVRPSYYHHGKVIGPGSRNPLGNRWMGLSLKGYGIHGTDVPSSIGHAASHGCIRMGKRDVEELFTLVSVGDVVEIHRTRDAELAGIFGADDESRSRVKTVAQATHSAPPAVMAAMADEF